MKSNFQNNYPLKSSGDISRLVEIVATLRDPQSGCPWDIRQDFSTIAPHTIEEAYEVVEAISRDNMEDLCEELGDLLFQVIFHASIGEEKGAFNIQDVINSICEKMLRRHPHVFGNAPFEEHENVEKIWRQAKSREREKKLGDDLKRASILDDIHASLPASIRAEKLQRRAGEVGFDWPDIKSVFEKIDEEMEELHEAIDSGDKNLIGEEFGDLLFAMVNLGRHLKIHCEIALHLSNQKFLKRFQSIEEALSKRGISLEKTPLQELERLWQEAKQAERSD